MTQANDWPSFSEELTRKTTEQLQIWADSFDKGVIKLSTMIAVVGTLYDTTSGLIDKDVSNLIADVHRDLAAQAAQQIK